MTGFDRDLIKWVVELNWVHAPGNLRTGCDSDWLLIGIQLKAMHLTEI